MYNCCLVFRGLAGLQMVQVDMMIVVFRLISSARSFMISPSATTSSSLYSDLTR